MSSSSSTTADPATTAQAAAIGVRDRMVSAWAANNAEEFAEIFTSDANLILPGVFVSGREQIRAFMARAFAGPYKGSRVTGTPIGLKAVGDNVCLVTTEGGVIYPGADAVAPEHAIKATWVLVRQHDNWLVTAYQNSPSARD